MSFLLFLVYCVLFKVLATILKIDTNIDKYDCIILSILAAGEAIRISLL